VIFRNYNATKARDMLASLRSVHSKIKCAPAGTGAISLVLGGTSIANIMMLAVKERIRDIGVMKALDGSMHDIRMQYLLDADVLGIVSCLIRMITLH
jgi:putative ABC transport system permease protein